MQNKNSSADEMAHEHHEDAHAPGEHEQSHEQHENMSPDEHAAHQEHGAAEHGAAEHGAAEHGAAEHGAAEHGDHSDHGGHGGHGDHGDQQDHSGHVDHSEHEQMFKKRFWVCLVLSIPVLLYSPMLQSWFGYTMPTFPGSPWIGPLFAIIVFAYGGVPFLQMAVPEIRERKPGMMTLISLAITVALTYSLAALVIDPEGGFFWELVLLIDVMLLGHWLEMRSVRQASGSLNELAKLMPDTAERILADGSVEEVSVNDLKQGEIVLIRPGASVPTDGEIIEGGSSVNESMITGESMPVGKEPGDKVIAGTVNGDGSLRVRVTAIGDDTALAGIMRLVKQAQQSKSKTQLLADRAAGWLFYIAVGVAVITAIAWTAAVGFNVEVVGRVATVLVIACPHALGLAVPLVVAISTSLAARNGILIRDRLALEEARLIDTVIFDKTGTLTKGEFGVVGQATIDEWSDEMALALTAAIEGDSEHTIARGIRNSAEERKLSLPQIIGFEAIQGRGVKAEYEGKTVYVGGPRLLEMLELDLPEAIAAFAEDANQKGQSVVYLADDDQVVAAYALADVVRPESRLAVEQLHKMGIEVAMLTGDSEAVAKAVADDLNIDAYFAEVLPENKDQKVQELQEQGKKVAMVGDGVNDAPALTRADVGIAIGGGTDVAIESAGIILVQSDPMGVVKTIELSRSSRRKMVQNLWWATGYNIVAIPLAAGVLAPIGIILSPALGALLMSVSTIIVAFNAQTLRRTQLGKA